MRTSLRRIAMAASAVIAVGAATAALPDTVGAGAGSAGASRLVLRSASVPPTTVGTMAARIPPTGGDCVMRRRWVINRWGHRVLRWTRACY